MPAVLPIDMFANALMLLGVMGAAQTNPRAEDTEFMRRVYNRLGGQWNRRKRNCYFIRRQAFTLPANPANPPFYTIGASTNTPAPDLALKPGQGDRPERIDQAWWMLKTASPNVLLPLDVINVDQYDLISIPTLTATLPNTLYYAAGDANVANSPNGVLAPWPQPTELSDQLQLTWWNQVLQIAAGDVATAINFPDGYEEAFTLTLAEKAWLAFPKRTDLEELKRQARMARADMQATNVPPPKISVTDGALHQKSQGFNWLIRSPG